MKDRLAAVLSSLNDDGVAVAQMTLRKDGSLETFGDPSIAIDTLTLLLKFGPAKLQELTSSLAPGRKCPYCGCTNAPDQINCGDCGRDIQEYR